MNGATSPTVTMQDRMQSGLSVSEALAEQLRTRILDGDFAAGQRLIEADLIEEFVVGRSAVREALKHLEATGLVDIKRQRGASVVRLTREKLVHLFEIRERLEGLAAFLAAERSAREKNQTWLAGQLEIWSDRTLDRSEREHMQRNVDFHDGLVEMGKNSYLRESLSRLQIPAYRHRFIRVIDDHVRQKSAGEHLEIIAAIQAGDPQRAEAAMRHHVRETAKLAASVAD
ncbi:GntR family transcriptional regulator [Hyphomonas sp. KY3]|jgi:DNA-binding GntR family transcriptional regulator|uniref:GntR family transcriptional regulator n=1 Tax=unclassified Hyphomonas TaxID=2630699 RepID=UPI001A8F7E85|nr:GntR family transcriptional regulator [Hyphomonas sp. KY3]